MFAQVGKETCELVPLKVGLPEGAKPSPNGFLLVANKIILAIKNWARGVDGAGLQLTEDGEKVTTLFYADDGKVHTKGRTRKAAMEVMQRLVDEALAPVLEELQLEPNLKPSKTSYMVDRPLDGRARLKREKKEDGMIELTWRGLVIARISEYDYLGGRLKEGGGPKTTAAHVEKLQRAGQGVARQISTSSLLLQPVEVGLLLVKSNYIPATEYALGLMMPTRKQLSDLERKEAWVLQTLLGNYTIPHAGARAVCGMASMETRQELRVWHLYREFVEAPPTTMHRKVMRKEALHCSSLEEAWEEDPRLQRFWLNNVNGLLGKWGQGMDEDEQGRLLTMAEAVDRNTQYKKDGVLKSAIRQQALNIEAGRRTAVLEGLRSLNSVRELIDTPNRLPCLHEPRTYSLSIRIAALGGGELGLFGREATKDRDRCPHPTCTAGEPFTIPHLFRDCLTFRDSRLEAYRVAHEYLKRWGLMDDDLHVERDREQWYRLSMGAHVTEEFAKLGHNIPTHLARDKATDKPRTDQQIVAHNAVAAKMATYVIGVYEKTVQVILQEGVVTGLPRLRWGKLWEENPAGRRREEGGERSESGSEEEDDEVMSWSGGEEGGS